MIKDTTQLQGFGNIKLPKIKGTVEIRLHNPTTGKTEIQRGENMITDAVYDIFASNLCGSMNYKPLLPIYSKMFGGILCFGKDLDISSEDAAKDYYIPDNSDDGNSITAHAGQTVSADADDLKRGAPDFNNYNVTDGTVTMAWTWAPSKGNGAIKSLALTHADVGDFGTGSYSQAFANGSPVLDALLCASGGPGYPAKWIENTTFDDNASTLLHFVANDGYGYKFYASGSTISIKRFPLAYKTVGLVATEPYTSLDSRLTGTFTKNVSVGTTYYTVGREQPFYYFDKTTSKLWLFYCVGASSSSNKVQVDVIDLSNWNSLSTTHSEFAVGDGVIYNLCNQQIAQPVPYADGYVYLRTTVYGSDSYRRTNGFVQVKLTDFTDKQTLSVITTPYGGVMLPDRAHRITVGRNFVINNGVMYPAMGNYTECSGPDWDRVRQFATMDSGVGLATITGKVAPGNPFCTTISKFYLGTKYNLSSQVTKTPSQSMVITYTLTEVEPE